MGVWNTFKSSYTSAGVHSNSGSYNPGMFGARTSWKLANPGRAVPMEGLLHSIKRGVVDSFIEHGHAGTVMSGADKVRYGGTMFSSGGIREAMHEVEQIGTSGMYKLGARKSTIGMLGSGAMKLITPAMFLYNAATQGVGQATKDAVEQGVMFGAGKWALGRLGMTMASPVFLAGIGLAGAGIAAQKALQFGKKYNDDVRAVSFGNAFNDVYGTAATMRQASVNAIQSSKINGRSVLNFEASLLHS